jgi:dihydrofolate reductase
MRKLVVGTFVTVDGVMQAPGGPDEDREGGFEHGGWSVNYWDEPMGQAITEQTLRGGALLLGRKTYDIFAAHWPRVSDEDPVAAKLNSMPKYVASRTLRDVDWNNSTLIKGDVAEAVARLKQEPGGDIQVTGSGDLIQTLLKDDLVDELVLWVFPLVLGTGKRLFGSGTLPANLKLTNTRTFDTGVTVHTYERAGDVQYGTFAVDEQTTSEDIWKKPAESTSSSR